MPRPQTALRTNYNFGAPSAIAPVLLWQVLRGGRIHFAISNESANVLVVTAQVSKDNSSWATTTAAANINAISAVSIQPHCVYENEVLLRQNTDLYFRLEASGLAQGVMQLWGDELQLDLMPTTFPVSQPNPASFPASAITNV